MFTEEEMAQYSVQHPAQECRLKIAINEPGDPLIGYREGRLLESIGDGCWWTAPAPTED